MHQSRFVAIGPAQRDAASSFNKSQPPSTHRALAQLRGSAEAIYLSIYKSKVSEQIRP